MLELKELIQNIQEIIIPIAMISGIGITALLTQTRYGRVVDITRQLNKEKLSLFTSKVSEDLPDIKLKIIERRIMNIDSQLYLFSKRGIFLKRALTSFLSGVFLFIFSSLLILLQESIPLTILVPVTALSFISGLTLLVVGGALVIFDLTYSRKAALMDIEGTNEIIKSFS
jgi:hypothetical protein